MKEWMADAIREFEGDLRACHEYYCKYNCGTLGWVNPHTPRCEKLRARWGFPEYTPANVVDRKV